MSEASVFQSISCAALPKMQVLKPLGRTSTREKECLYCLVTPLPPMLMYLHTHGHTHTLAHSPELNGSGGAVCFWWKALLSRRGSLHGESPSRSAPSFKNRAPFPEKCFPGCFLCSPASLPNSCSISTSLGSLAAHAAILWLAMVGSPFCPHVSSDPPPLLSQPIASLCSAFDALMGTLFARSPCPL